MNRSRTLNTLSGLGLLAAAGILSAPGTALAQGGDPYALLPSSITLTGVARDFRAYNVAGGHPDFGFQPPHGLGHYVNIVDDRLLEGKPVFKSTGVKVGQEFRDIANRNIIGPKPYLHERAGDQSGTLRLNQTGVVYPDHQVFRQWYHDVPGVNMSRAVPITLRRQAGTNRYIYDDQLDTSLPPGEGFFIVNNHLYGNAQGGNKNYEFTYEVETTFTYVQNSGQVFTFIGDDDMWVFIDGKLVIDIGGMHNSLSQTIEVDRCNWLVDGQNYQLKIFFAERNKPDSRFRIETTLMNLRSVDPPPTAALAD